MRSIFSIQYALIATLLALFSSSSTVSSQWYLAPIFAFVISYLASLTAGTRFHLSQAVSYASRVLAILIGASFIALTLLIFTHVSLFKDISIVLQPGIFGSLLLFALNLFYLPNAAIAVLSYFTGTGFAVGADTLVSPFTNNLGGIPALPLLAILPTTSSKWALLAIVIVVAVGALLAMWALASGTRSLIQALILIALSISVLGYLASGSLMTDAMSAVGVSVWKLSASLALEIGLGVALMVLLPQIRLRRR